jgi:DNA repair exonuclease SbcCD ATPase subunit
MLNFKSIKYKNILSTGNVFTSIDLDTHKTTLIVGENGAGKSTMLDALSFALYGKAFRKITKNQLINSVNNKGLLVEVNFKTLGKEYTIKRGIKPALFEIWCEGVMLNQDASARDYQKYLEENVLKMDYKSFGQVVVLGSSTFVPFMQLPAASRRTVIEDLLDIQIFTTMNNLLKDDISENKDSVSDVKHNLSLIDAKISASELHDKSLLKIRSEEIEKIKIKMKNSLLFIDEENEIIDSLNYLIAELQPSYDYTDELKKELSELSELHMSTSLDITKLKKDSKFFQDNSYCPSCLQNIGHGHSDYILRNKDAKIKVLEDKKSAYKEGIEKIESKLTDAYSNEDEIYKAKNDIASHNANIKITKNNLLDMSSEIESLNETIDDEKSTNTSELKKEYEENRILGEELSREREMLGVLALMLKDGGIKTRIIKQYVPIMNKLINKYLASMEFFVEFQLDENFNETIKSRYRDIFSYSSFSEGEKLRIDLALLFTWRAVSKLRNSVSTNLLIMDEIMDSSLDTTGTDEFLRIIQEITVDSNVFIISHKGDQLYDKFDNTIKFAKQKNFSRIVE